MKIVWFLAALAAVYCSDKHAPAKVQVYSYKPGKYGNENILICFVSGFHPPDITIQLLQDGIELHEAKQTDLAFRQNWQFHLTKSMAFKPVRGDAYTCKVTHGFASKDFAWEPNL